ncbi:MAG: hypothetical protein Q8P49_01715 [Candidatus Liptonbacteria bacterium]|nr:hypothetical protein [Candidatus Liptonbacteria bacterium]
MNKKIIAPAGFLALIALGFWFLFSPGSSDGRYDAFAQCLAEKKITMYGANWCPHCQNEKQALGSSFRFVPYVECPDEPEKCLAQGVNGYPTWIFPDGRKLEGEQGIKKLSQESGCPLPARS